MLKDSRKIAAILAADIVEYSRLMGADEAGTLAALKIRRAIFDRLVKEFDGQEFGSVGDSLMAQFPSVINAVCCAQAIQRTAADENESLPADRRMLLRIGVNLGDVIEENGALFGDGVNIAARLQALATPGGVLVSGSVYEQVKNKLSASFTFMGARQVKNISEPVPCYEVTEPAVASFAKRVAAALQRRVAIAAAAYVFLSWLLISVFTRLSDTVGAPAWTLPALIALLAAGFVPAMAVASRFDPRHRRRFVPAVTGIAIILAVASWLLWGTAERESKNSLNARDQKSIAVLPFADMSENRDQEYFADGLAEDVRNLLANIPTLKVIGRSSSFQFKGRSADLRVIGTELGAAYVLEGSVRRSGDRLRVTADLIGTQDGVHRWSNTYDRALGDVLKLQDELASGIARALEVDVAADNLHSSAALKSSEAYEFYLRALHAEDRQDRTGFEAAANYLQQALQLDPTFAAPYTELAFVYMAQAEIKAAPPQTFERARSTAAKAVELDPRSARAHAVVAWAHMAYDWDWTAADAELKQALFLTPYDGLTLKCAARLSEVRGDWAEALRLLSAAVARDPLDPPTYIVLSGVYARAGRLDEAEAAVRRVLQISPTYESAPWRLGLVLLARGRPEEALEAMQRVTNQRLRTGGLVSVYYALGRQADSDAALAWMRREHAKDDAYGIAQAYAFRGEIDAALQWLDRAYSQRDASLYRITGDPLLKRLESDPRFKAFLRKMRVPE